MSTATVPRPIALAHNPKPIQYRIESVEIAVRVSYGAVALDRRVPGWEHCIRLEDLNIADAKRCIIGQVLGDYAYVFSVLGYDADELSTFSHGFSGNGIMLPPNYMERLREAWVALIVERRARMRGPL